MTDNHNHSYNTRLQSQKFKDIQQNFEKNWQEYQQVVKELEIIEKQYQKVKNKLENTLNKYHSSEIEYYKSFKFIEGFPDNEFTQLGIEIVKQNGERYLGKGAVGDSLSWRIWVLDSLKGGRCPYR